MAEAMTSELLIIKVETKLENDHERLIHGIYSQVNIP